MAAKETKETKQLDKTPILIQPKTQPVTDSDGNMFGNLDEGKKYPFPAIWGENQNIVVVSQSRIIKTGGEDAIAPHSVPVQVYSRELYENMLQNDKFKAGGLKVELIHDPLKK